jgi:hypothetical protein
VYAKKTGPEQCMQVKTPKEHAIYPLHTLSSAPLPPFMPFISPLRSRHLRRLQMPSSSHRRWRIGQLRSKLASSSFRPSISQRLLTSQGTNHEKTSTDSSVRSLKTKLLGDLDQTAGGSLSGETLGLVDLAQHGVGGL